ASLAMPDLLGVYHLASKGMYNALVPQADSKYRGLWSKLLYDVGADAKVLPVCRVAGARRDDNAVRLHLFYLRKRYLVVSYDRGFGVHLAQELRNVVDKRVIVVDDQYLFLSGQVLNLRWTSCCTLAKSDRLFPFDSTGKVPLLYLNLVRSFVQV